MSKSCYIFLLLILSFQLEANEEESWDEEWEEEQAYQINHKLSYGYSQILTDSDFNQKNSVMNEARAISQFEYQGDELILDFELELLADLITKQYQANIYQANMLIPFKNGIDLKIGRQVITWGTGDLLFLNDLFAKDWKSFFNGRRDDYLKPPVDSIRVSHYGKSINFDIAFMPRFSADRIPNGERYSFYIPGAGIIQPQPELLFPAPSSSEMSARLFANYNSIEWAIYGYDGFFKSPVATDSIGEFVYNRMRSVGASVRAPFGGGLINSELSIYFSRDDRHGKDPYVQNGVTKFLLGYEKELARDLTIGVQGYVEQLHHYNALIESMPEGNIIVSEKRTILTLRLTQSLFQQSLTSSAMIFYSPTDDDYYLRYQGEYRVNDQLQVSMGINWLDGRSDNTFLAQMHDNSNLFFRLNYHLN